jgi:hypothetical protein
LYPTVKNTLTGCIAFPALDALREGYDVYPVVDAIAGTSVEAHRAGLERRAVLVGLSALVLASDVIGGIAPGIGVMLAARAVQGKRPANTLKSAVRGHKEAAARKELPCPTRL